MASVGVSAAEKYAELEAAGLERPRCECHGEPLVWSKGDRNLGGSWKCSRRWSESDKGREAQHRYNASDKGKTKRSQYRMEYYALNRERENARSRLYIKTHPKVALFGMRFYMPDEQFAHYARQLRDARKEQQRGRA